MALPLAYVLMGASGFAALGYQLAWTQQVSLWLGHDGAAVLAVVTAFFGGVAAGALVLGARIERSARPGLWYAACEAVIAAWCLVLAFAMEPAARMMLSAIGAQPAAVRHWSVAFGGTFLLLLPATASMGATLPAMQRALARWRGRGSGIAALYAANTAGAVAGVLAAAFWLVPRHGLLVTAVACAVLNLLCAFIALRLFTGRDAPSRAESTGYWSGTLPRLGATGLLGIAYEVLAVRVLGQVAEKTVYTFALLLAVYLVGTAIGAAVYARVASGADGRVTTDRLLRLLCGACLLGLAVLGFSQPLAASLRYAFGNGMGAALLAEAALALAAFLLPTIAMGALFSHLAQAARAAGVGFGKALGVNTLGAALAAPLFGVVLVPAIGSKAALLLVAAGYLALLSRAAWRTPASWIAVAAVAVAAWTLPALVIVDVPEGGRLLGYREGAVAAVAIVQDAHGVATLHIDNRQQEGSSATVVADARQALIPLLLHPQPRRALFLGLGTGVTASAAAGDAQLEVDAVELLPEVIEASRHFIASPGVVPDPRLHLIAADARRFVRSTAARYDLIVADNFHPARSGSGALYTVEHFRAVRERLAPGGIFCQWLPLHQLDLATLRSIVRSFVTANRQAWAVLATHSLDTPVVGLVARADGERFDLARVRERMASARLPRAPAQFGLADDLALFGSFIAGPGALAAFAADAPLNTDDHQVVSYIAPRATYAPDLRPRDRLLALLAEVHVEPVELVAGGDAAWAARLSSYDRARDKFIAAGRDVRPSGDARRMLAQVREPLLDVLRTSPDFRPAYDPLLRMAGAIAETDPAAARALLGELNRLQPQSRP